MQSKPVARTLLAATLAGVVFSPTISVAGPRDFGVEVEDRLGSYANQLFGIVKPLGASALPTTGPYRTLTQSAADQLLFAKGLKVEYLTREAANATDMMAFFPADNPTHLITCIEAGRAAIVSDGDTTVECGTDDKGNPSVQRINLSTGTVATILRGMNGCDGIRTTPWGTILATEENSTGGAYEILDPLAVTNQNVLDRATGTVSDPVHIVKRTALPTIAFEGLGILPSGVVCSGDELRPGTGTAGVDGGSIFKFIPTTPRTTSTPITNLTQSPLVAGKVYALQVSCVSTTQQFGQGCEVGNAAWIAVNAATARTDANANGATGYYRPEDLEVDRTFTGPGARFCWTNTEDFAASSWGETMCAIDSAPLTADSTQRTVVVNRFIEGDHDFNNFDNLAFQPGTRNLYVLEDPGDGGDVFACLPDGLDRDIKSDGCVRVFSVRDFSAEPTGLIFSSDGTSAYLSIQHSDDTNMPKVDDFGTDDIIKITGFKLNGSDDHGDDHGNGKGKEK